MGPTGAEETLITLKLIASTSETYKCICPTLFHCSHLVKRIYLHNHKDSCLRDGAMFVIDFDRGFKASGLWVIYTRWIVQSRLANFVV